MQSVTKYFCTLKHIFVVSKSNTNSTTMLIQLLAFSDKNTTPSLQAIKLCYNAADTRSHFSLNSTMLNPLLYG